MNSLVLGMNSNGNEISSARNMDGEENPSHQTVQTEENDNNRERALEGSVSNVSMKRFKVMSTEDHFKWLLPEEIAEHMNDHFQTFLPEKRVHDSILMENPIPSNVDLPQMVDDFIVQLMSKNEAAVDLSFGKVQQKIMNVMGPLARVWKALEDVKNDPTLTLSLEEVATNTGKAVLFLGRHFKQRLTTVGSMLSPQS